MSDTLSVVQFRRAMRHVGVDLNRKSTRHMLAMYGSNLTMTRTGFNAIVSKSTVASPSRYFWIPIDPRGKHVRVRRPLWNDGMRERRPFNAYCTMALA